MPTSTRPPLRTVPPLSPPGERRPSPLLQLAPAGLVAAALFAIAYANGGYGLTCRTIVAVALWWTIIVAGAFGLLPRAAPTRASLAVGGLLAGFTVWTLASTIWAASAENAFDEFNRASLYLAVYVLAAAGTTRRTVGRYVDALLVGIVAVSAIALVSRLFPHLFSNGQIGVFLPNAAARLSFPVGYWNGLAIFVGLAVPLCLRAALVARREVVRGLAVAAVPILASVVYLTSSRGGAATAAVGALVFLATTARRWRALGALLAAAAGSLLAVGTIAQQHTLVNGPLTGGVAAGQGRTATVVTLCACALSGVLLVGGERAFRGRFGSRPRLGWSLVVAAAIAVLAAVVLAHPVRRFDSFKQLPSAQQASPDFATTHLLSGNGSGRWQFWTSAVHELESAPLLGRGAGSFQYWWAQHASFTYSLKNAHSLYLEVAGELGIVGFLLLTSSFVLGLGAGAIRSWRAHGDERVTIAALTGVLAAFMVGAAVDWVWELTAVGVVGMVALSLVTGPATGEEQPDDESSRSVRRRSRVASSVGALALAWVLICVQAIPWLASQRISDSQAAARRGDTKSATNAATDAKRLEPWAASPYLQLALLAEEQGSLSSARRWIYAATRRDRDDWSVWWVAARIERESHHPVIARRNHAKAASLNPRSPLFSSDSGS